MSNQHDEITFSQIFGIMKKSFVRALCYVLVSVILASSLLFLLKTITSTKYSVVNITITDGSEITLSDLNSKKASAVKSALGEEADKDFTNTVLKNLSITADLPDDVEEEEEYEPNNFSLYLQYSGLGLTKPELNDLLKKISVELLNSFAIAEFPEVEISDNLDSDFLVLEYFQIADELYEQASNIYSAVSSQTANLAETTSFTHPESKRTFADIKGSLNSTLLTIDNLRAYIISNKIENIPNSLISLLNYKMNDATSKKIAYSQMVEDALEGLKNYPQAVTPSSSGTESTTYLVVDNSNYNAIVESYYELIKLQGNAEHKELQYINYLVALGAGEYNPTTKTYTANATTPTLSSDTNGYVKNALKIAVSNLKEYFNEYKSLAEEFNKEYTSNTETQVDNPKIVNESPITISIILLIVVLVALIAYLTAFFQVYNKNKNVVAVAPTNELNANNDLLANN